IPDADAHGRAFFRVHRLAALVLLIDAHVQDVESSQPPDNRCLQTQLKKQNVQAWLIDDRYNFSEQNIHMATPLGDRCVDPKHAQQQEEDRNNDETGKERNDGGKKKSHRLISWTTCSTWAKMPSRTLRTYPSKAPSPARVNSANWLAREISGCTSAWAFKVSISAARFDCSILWSADA